MQLEKVFVKNDARRFHGYFRQEIAKKQDFHKFRFFSNQLLLTKKEITQKYTFLLVTDAGFIFR